MGSEIKILKANGGVKEKGMCLKDQYMGGRAMGAGGASPPVFAKFVQNLPFLPQILAFLQAQTQTGLSGLYKPVRFFRDGSTLNNSHILNLNQFYCLLLFQ